MNNFGAHNRFRMIDNKILNSGNGGSNDQAFNYSRSSMFTGIGINRNWKKREKMHGNIKFKTKSGSGIVLVVSSCILYWHDVNFLTSKRLIQNLTLSFSVDMNCSFACAPLIDQFIYQK